MQRRGVVEVYGVHLAGRGGADERLHRLLALRAQDHDQQPTLALVCERDLLHQGEPLLAPAEDERVPGFDHLPGFRRSRPAMLRRKNGAAFVPDLCAALLEIVDARADGIRHHTNHESEDQHPCDGCDETYDPRGSLGFRVGSWAISDRALFSGAAGMNVGIQATCMIFNLGRRRRSNFSTLRLIGSHPDTVT
jgi:hypothetical protein